MDRPSIPDPPHTGGCLCGAVRYTLASRPLAVNACHCNDCKKLSGGTHIVMLTGLRADFTHQGETQAYAKTAASGRVGMIQRCAQCGVRLWHEPQLGPQFVLISAGTLDDPSWVVPVAHIWTKSAAAHEHFAADALLVEGQPENREGMIAAFKKIYG